MTERQQQKTARKWRVTVLISGSGTNLGALISALPTNLSNCTITHVLASKSTAGGLLRASSASPSIPTSVFSPVTFKKQGLGDRSAYDLVLAEKLRKTRPDLVVLAGWMLILSEGFLDALKTDWTEEEASSSPSSSSSSSSISEIEVEGIKSLSTPGSSPYPSSPSPSPNRPIPIINLHPALPGTFPGAHAILDAYNAFNHPANPSSKITKTGIMIHRVIPLLDAGEPVVVREVELKEGESLEELEERIHKVEHKAIVDAVEEVTKMLGDGSWWK